MKMNVETAKKILKENHYIVESEESMSSKIWGLCEDGWYHSLGRCSSSSP